MVLLQALPPEQLQSLMDAIRVSLASRETNWTSIITAAIAIVPVVATIFSYYREVSYLREENKSLRDELREHSRRTEQLEKTVAELNTVDRLTQKDVERVAAAVNCPGVSLKGKDGDW